MLNRTRNRKSSTSSDIQLNPLSNLPRSKKPTEKVLFTKLFTWPELTLNTLDNDKSDEKLRLPLKLKRPAERSKKWIIVEEFNKKICHLLKKSFIFISFVLCRSLINKLKNKIDYSTF